MCAALVFFFHNFIAACQGYCASAKMPDTKRHGMNSANSTIKNVPVCAYVFLFAITLSLRGC